MGTKLAGDHVQVLVDGYDLTGDLNRIMLDENRDVYDVTAFSDAVHKFIIGKRNINLSHVGYFNFDTVAENRSHDALNGIDINGIVSVLIGDNQPPAVGDLMYSLLTLQGNYVANPQVGTYIPFSARFVNQGNVGYWGTVVAPPTTFDDSVTASGDDVLNSGAASSNGGIAYLHVLQKADNATYEIRIQGDSNSGFTSNPLPLDEEFSLDASAIGSERLDLSGTIPQYIRWKATITGTSGEDVIIAINLVRF